MDVPVRDRLRVHVKKEAVQIWGGLFYCLKEFLRFAGKYNFQEFLRIYQFTSTPEFSLFSKKFSFFKPLLQSRAGCRFFCRKFKFSPERAY